jgi:hypothetical protein
MVAGILADGKAERRWTGFNGVGNLRGSIREAGKL